MGNYHTYRVVYNKTTCTYDLVTAYYDSEGNINDVIFVANLGETLGETKEVLEGLVNDIDNWSTEELYVELD